MTALERIAPMQAALATAETPDECASLAAKAKAVQTWARHIGLSLQEQNRIARFRVDCMRKAGGLLMRANLRRGRPGPNGDTLSPLGVEKKQSSRWQRLARIDDALIEGYANEVGHSEGEFTHAGLLRFVAAQAKAERRAEVAADAAPEDVVEAELGAFVERAQQGERFACIYADPPWRYGNQATRASTDNHYVTMSVDEICALPVREIAADNAHLHLWTTNAFLFDAARVMQAWGFEYKSCFVWVKPQMGIGNYWRVSHEFLLLGIRGDCPFLARDAMSWAELPRGRHSAKPDAIRQLVERVSPGPRIELFARERIDGWSAWGNETKSTLFTARPQGGALNHA